MLPCLRPGETLCSLMDTLQAGFQTAPVKLPLTPYQKAVSAKEAIVKSVQQQMTKLSNNQVKPSRWQLLPLTVGQKAGVAFLDNSTNSGLPRPLSAELRTIHILCCMSRWLPMCRRHAAFLAGVCVAKVAVYRWECMQGGSKCCLASMMAGEQLTESQIIDNVIAAAFGNASAGPSAAKAFQHLAAGCATTFLCILLSIEFDNIPVSRKAILLTDPEQPTEPLPQHCALRHPAGGHCRELHHRATPHKCVELSCCRRRLSPSRYCEACQNCSYVAEYYFFIRKLFLLCRACKREAV